VLAFVEREMLKTQQGLEDISATQDVPLLNESHLAEGLRPKPISLVLPQCYLHSIWRTEVSTQSYLRLHSLHPAQSGIYPAEFLLQSGRSHGFPELRKFHLQWRLMGLERQGGGAALERHFPGVLAPYVHSPKSWNPTSNSLLGF
jgi:hypothetical protein